MPLRLGWEHAVEGEDGRIAECVGQRLAAFHDFRLSGKKGQDIARMYAVRLADSRGHLRGTVAHVGFVIVDDFHGKHPPLAFE